MSLPTAWVEKIFGKLTINYGVDFMARYKGLPISDVKTDWSDTLGCFVQRPDAIAYFLENLPDRPPTAQQAKAICLTAPRIEPQLAIQAPDPAGKARITEELAKLAHLREANPVQQKDCRAWARKLLAEHAAGFKKTPAVLQMARNAVGAE